MLSFITDAELPCPHVTLTHAAHFILHIQIVYCSLYVLCFPCIQPLSRICSSVSIRLTANGGFHNYHWVNESLLLTITFKHLLDHEAVALWMPSHKTEARTQDHDAPRSQSQQHTVNITRSVSPKHVNNPQDIETLLFQPTLRWCLLAMDSSLDPWSPAPALSVKLMQLLLRLLPPSSAP